MEAEDGCSPEAASRPCHKGDATSQVDESGDGGFVHVQTIPTGPAVRERALVDGPLRRSYEYMRWLAKSTPRAKVVARRVGAVLRCHPLA